MAITVTRIRVIAGVYMPVKVKMVRSRAATIKVHVTRPKWQQFLYY